MGLSEQDIAAIADQCRNLPPARGVYVQRDYITNLLLAVLDYKSDPANVRKALRTYKQRLWNDVRTLEGLKQFLARYPDTPEGNVNGAADIWGFNAGRRLHELRSLVKFFERRGVVTQELLTHWARSSNYRDFVDRIPGLGREVYEGIQIRQGYGPIKPGPHLSKFMTRALGHPLPDNELALAVEHASGKLGLMPRELDRRIYEHETA